MMATRYVAYGLALRSSFALPGMRPTDSEGLRSLSLDLVTQAELASMWSGSDGVPVWSGYLGDGGTLTIEHGIGGDLLFTHDDHARHRLDASMRSLAVAPRRSGAGDWQRTLLTKVLSSISVMRGYEALHASAVASPWGVLAIAAPTGMGKTTLALELMRRGWPLLTDDVLTLGATPDGVLAYPGTPHMNVAVDGPLAHCVDDDIGPTLGFCAGEHWLAARNAASEPGPVRAIFLLERGPERLLDVESLSPSPLPLAPYVLGLSGDIERERRRFDLYGELMSSTALLRLTAGGADRPGDLAALIDEVVAGDARPLAAGATR